MGQPGWEQGLGENGYLDIRTAESLCCSPETITALVIGCTSMQKKKFKVKKIKSYGVTLLFSRCGVRLFSGPMDCSLPGSSVQRVSQARILEWVAISFSRGSS